jgi:hypothetical protein
VAKALTIVLSLLAVLGGSGVARAQNVRLSMSASSRQVQVGEPFAIEIRADVTGADIDELELPDFGELEVLGRRTSRPFSFSFGFGSAGNRANVQSQIIHSFTLRARESGKFKINPAVAVAGGRRFASQPLTIEATGAALPGQAAGAIPDPNDPRATAPLASTTPPEGPLDGANYDEDAFVRTVVSKHEAFVGEQVTVTVYLYLRGSVASAPAITKEPTAEGFWIEDLLPPNRPLSATRQMVNGRGFNVYVLRRFAAFPLRTGQLTIGPTSIELGGGPSIFDMLTGPSQPLRRAGVPVSLTIKEPPAGGAPDAPLVVGEVTLAATLDPLQLNAGDAATLTLTLKGSGNLKAASFSAPMLTGVDVLKPEIDDRINTDFDIVGGERTVRWLLLARTPGEVTIPPFRVRQLNPETGELTERATKPLTMSIGGQAQASADPPTPATKGDAAVPGASNSASPEIDMKAFGPVRTTSALLRRERPFYEAAWYSILLALAPLSLGAASVWSALQRRRAAKFQGKRGERALQEAQEKLEQARKAMDEGNAKAACAAVAASLRSALEAKLGENLGSLTYPALRVHLTERGMGAPLAERIVREIEANESAGFSPISLSQPQLATILESSRGLLREINRFSNAEAA